MNPILKNALVGMAVLIGFGPVSAFAQDAACSCTTAYSGAAGAIGSLVHVRGEVLISRAAGYAPAKRGSSVDLGSRIVVGPKGSASAQIGDCNLNIPANSSLDISQNGSNICLKVEQAAQSAGAGASGGAGSAGGVGVAGFGPPEAIFAGAVLTTGVLAATQKTGNGVSR